MTKITQEQKIARMASIMAISNMGLLHFCEGRNLLSGHIVDRAEYDVCSLAGHLIESDEHEEIFGAEAKMWEEITKKDGLEKMMENYPHHREWMERLINL